VSFAAIVAHMIGLTACLHICIHARNGGHIVATELRVWHFMIDRIIHTRYTGYFIQILFVLVAFMMLRLRWIKQVSKFLYQHKHIKMLLAQ